MKKLIAIFLFCSSIGAFAQSNTDKLFLKKINEFRAQNGLKALAYNVALDSAAEWHSAYMAKTGVCGHSEEMFSTPQSRIVKYFPNAFNGNFDVYEVFENACKGVFYGKEVSDQEIVDQAFNLWLKSPAHKANMLSKTAKYIGFGDQVVGKIKQPFPDTFYSIWCTMVVATDPIVRVIND